MSFLNTYVLDTNAIISLYLTELGGTKVIDKISVIYIPDYVFREELLPAIRKESIDNLDSHCRSRPNIEIVPTSEFSQCIKFVKSWMKAKFHHIPIHKGELFCLALSLFLSRKNKSFVILITEEKRETVKIIEEFMNLQKIGIILSPIELLISLYCREKFIKEHQIKLAIKDYKLRRKRVENINNRILSELCRQKGFLEKYCSQECFQK